MSKAMQLEIKLVKSYHHQKHNIKESVRVLGLRKIGQTVVRNDSPVVRGLIRKAIHVLEVNCKQTSGFRKPEAEKKKSLIK